MTSTARAAARRRALPALLVALVLRPSEIYPQLFGRRAAGEILFFSGLSGVYVAHVVAQWVDLGDAIGFWPAAIATLVVGPTLGFVALYFAGGLLSWSAESIRGCPVEDFMYAAFGYATWPFLPLLLVVVPAELILFGTELFSASRPDGTASALVWGIRVLEIGTIFLWLYLMVKGTSVAARVSEREAVEAVALSIVEIAVIFILFAVIMLVSLLYW